MKILLQCTIQYAADDWHVGRFSLLAQELRKAGHVVVARDLSPDSRGIDPVLSRVSRDDFDELWLLGVDGGRTPALSQTDIEAVNAFHRAGGGLFTTRDHENMGRWLRQVERVGQAHFFHSSDCCELDTDRRRPDDVETKAISWPNYHSGANGDFERIEAIEPMHPLLAKADGGRIELFPAHPHEGAVGLPPSDPSARVVARGRSTVTGRAFDLVVAFERDAGCGRAIAESSIHHVADYNWEVARGAPTFVSEAPGDGMRREPRALEDIHAYVANTARWLAPRSERAHP
ncbi:hypothetical protein [Anaeromyxobacter oryzae]|uniref:ThuA-like domain-containing protein n=1 Tax=Anaeromyxobacter oryzae TaxID=2918170 RepID=A0ABN6MXM1_9BACT|nr:hypothetical protein [Anaeromyxobacter oryzae]BDG05005.1 hypothetical protein AMOR_40010 [Anaeromyxobacter oryzae]